MLINCKMNTWKDFKPLYQRASGCYSHYKTTYSQMREAEIKRFVDGTLSKGQGWWWGACHYLQGNDQLHPTIIYSYVDRRYIHYCWFPTCYKHGFHVTRSFQIFPPFSPYICNLGKNNWKAVCFCHLQTGTGFMETGLMTFAIGNS